MDCLTPYKTTVNCLAYQTTTLIKTVFGSQTGGMNNKINTHFYVSKGDLFLYHNNLIFFITNTCTLQRGKIIQNKKIDHICAVTVLYNRVERGPWNWSFLLPYTTKMLNIPYVTLYKLCTVELAIKYIIIYIIIIYIIIIYFLFIFNKTSFLSHLHIQVC